MIYKLSNFTWKIVINIYSFKENNCTYTSCTTKYIYISAIIINNPDINALHFLFFGKNISAQEKTPVLLFVPLSGPFKAFVSCLTQLFKYTVRGMIASQRKAPSPYPYFCFAICMHLHDFIMHMPFVPWVGTMKKKKKKEMEPVQIHLTHRNTDLRLDRKILMKAGFLIFTQRCMFSNKSTN